MSIHLTASGATMDGDWTLAGAARNLDSLAGLLHKIHAGDGRNLCIDCRNVSKADASGLQVLHVWLECARMRGVEPTLINVPERLLSAMQGLSQHFIIVPYHDEVTIVRHMHT